MTGHPQSRRSSARPHVPQARHPRSRRRPRLVSSLSAVLLVVGLMLALGLLAAGCGSDATTTTAAAPTTTSAPPAGDTTTSEAAGTTDSSAVQPAEDAFPVTITDDSGREVTIETKPGRIVSTAPASTEILFAIGAGDRVVGVNTLDDYPPEVANIPKVGDYQLNTEAIMGLSPDLVLGYSGLGAEEALAPVRDEGAPVVLLEAKSVEGVYSDIMLVGTATGDGDQAAALVDSMKTQIAEYSAKAAAAGTAPKVFFAVDNTLWTVGTDTFVDDLLKLVNTVNIGSRAGTGSTPVGYYQFTPEQLVAADPDIVLLPKSAFMNGIEEFTKDPRFAGLTAVEQGHVVLIDDAALTRPGPRIVEGIKTLLEAVHPDVM